MLQRLGFPDVGPHRRFVSALAIDALGSGVWMPLSMLYFLHQTSLSLVQLGLAMTIANTVVIPVVPLIGSLVDRVGPRYVMQIGNAGAAGAFVLYPFAHSLVAVTVLVFFATATRQAFWGALGPMVTQITRPGERELWFGFLQAMRNAGYGVGGVLAAVALTIGSGAAFQSVVLANAASYVLAFVLMLGVAGGGRWPGTTRPCAPVVWWVAFTDRGYRTLIVVIFCYAMTTMTLNVSMPVYFVDSLGLPGWVPGTVFVINTVMIGVGQGLVVRRMTGHSRRRVLHVAVAFTAASFAMFYAADALSVDHRCPAGAARRRRLHRRRDDRRPDRLGAVRRDAATGPAGPVHGRHPAGVEHVGRDLAPALLGAARPRSARGVGRTVRGVRGLAGAGPGARAARSAGGPSGHQRRRARAGSGRLDRRGTVDLVARFVRARAKRVARDTAY